MMTFEEQLPSLNGMASKDYRKDNCKHEYIYKRIIDELRETVKYVITCKKCFYEPAEGILIQNGNPRGFMPEFFNDCDFFKNSDDLKLKKIKVTDLKPRFKGTKCNGGKQDV